MSTTLLYDFTIFYMLNTKHLTFSSEYFTVCLGFSASDEGEGGLGGFTCGNGEGGLGGFTCGNGDGGLGGFTCGKEEGSPGISSAGKGEADFGVTALACDEAKDIIAFLVRDKGEDGVGSATDNLHEYLSVSESDSTESLLRGNGASLLKISLGSVGVAGGTSSSKAM